MKDVHVISVPSSGTRFLAYRVLAPAHAEGRVKTYHIGTGGNKLEDSHVADAMAAGTAVVPVRDPMHVLISNHNRQRDVSLASLLMMVQLINRGAHPFRVDPPPGERQHKLGMLAEFLEGWCGLPRGWVDLACPWRVEDEWVVDDRTGLRAAYDAGRPRGELHEWARQIKGCGPVRAFYESMGYEIHPTNTNLAALEGLR